MKFLKKFNVTYDEWSLSSGRSPWLQNEPSLRLFDCVYSVYFINYTKSEDNQDAFVLSGHIKCRIISDFQGMVSFCAVFFDILKFYNILAAFRIWTLTISIYKFIKVRRQHYNHRHAIMKRNLTCLPVLLLLLISISPFYSYAGSNDDLIKAIRAHDADGVKVAINAGADVNKQDENGNLPLAGAAWWPDITKILLDAKAKVNLKSKSGMTPIMNAALLGETEIVKMYIDAKADLKETNPAGQQVLYQAAFNSSQASTLKVLIEGGADVNAKDNMGQTPIFGLAAYGKSPGERVATIKGQVPFLEKAGLTLPDRFKNPKESDYSSVGEMMKVLINAGADVNAEAKAGFSPLIWAARNNRTDAVKELIEGKANVNKQDISKHSPLAYAADAGNTEVVKMLAAAGADINAETWELDPKGSMTKGFTALTRAAMNNQTEVVRLLISLGAKVDEPVKGWGTTRPAWGTPCRYEMSGKTALFYATENDNFEMVKMLVEAKADVNKLMKYKFDSNCNIKVDFASPHGIAKSMKYDDIKDYLWQKMKGK